MKWVLKCKYIVTRVHNSKRGIWESRLMEIGSGSKTYNHWCSVVILTNLMSSVLPVVMWLAFRVMSFAFTLVLALIVIIYSVWLTSTHDWKATLQFSHVRGSGHKASCNLTMRVTWSWNKASVPTLAALFLYFCPLPVLWYVCEANDGSQKIHSLIPTTGATPPIHTLAGPVWQDDVFGDFHLRARRYGRRAI